MDFCATISLDCSLHRQPCRFKVTDLAVQVLLSFLLEMPSEADVAKRSFVKLLQELAFKYEVPLLITRDSPNKDSSPSGIRPDTNQKDTIVRHKSGNEPDVHHGIFRMGTAS